jgi:uncharacterized cofD-like protein
VAPFETLRPDQVARRPLRLVAIGGGTGLSTLLRGLKSYVVAPGVARIATAAHAIGGLAAIVTVTDDGGSSGRLRKELNVLPPGDIRNCMVALSEDENLLSRLFQYRFGSGELAGHNFGNLFLTALAAVVGDFAVAVRESSGILASRGHIFPSTMTDVQLEASMDDGSVVSGETNITASQRRIVELRLVPGNAQPLPETLQAIAAADVITLGPGSLFTSLVPNMLVDGIPKAIVDSRACKIFICNLMMQANESLGLSASEHLLAIRKHAGRKIFDYALVNDASPSPETLAKYQQQDCGPVLCDQERIEKLGVRCITGNFLEEAGGIARHNTSAIAERLLQVAYAHRPTNVATA